MPSFFSCLASRRPLWSLWNRILKFRFLDEIPATSGNGFLQSSGSSHLVGGPAALWWTICAWITVANLSIVSAAEIYKPTPNPPTDRRIGTNYTPAYAVKTWRV